MSVIAEMYPIPSEIKKFDVFLGNWDMEGTIKTGSKTMKLKGKWSFNTAAGGWDIKSSNKFEVGELSTYELDNLSGFDKEQGNCIHSLTNMAETQDHTASWSDESILKEEYEGLKDEKKFREDFVIRLVSPEEITIGYVEKVDGQIDSIMNVVLKK